MHKRNENIHPDKNVYMSMYNSVIQKVGKNENVHELMKDIQKVVYPSSRILLGHKKE